jgi:hypothetical protein
MLRRSSNAYGSTHMYLAHANIVQIELVAKFCRLRLHKVPRVADIEHEV